MIYGCTCVGTDTQDLTSQLAELTSTGCDKMFCDEISGATVDECMHRSVIAASGVIGKGG